MKKLINKIKNTSIVNKAGIIIGLGVLCCIIAFVIGCTCTTNMYTHLYFAGILTSGFVVSFIWVNVWGIISVKKEIKELKAIKSKNRAKSIEE